MMKYTQFAVSTIGTFWGAGDGQIFLGCLMSTCVHTIVTPKPLPPLALIVQVRSVRSGKPFARKPHNPFQISPLPNPHPHCLHIVLLVAVHSSCPLCFACFLCVCSAGTGVPAAQVCHDYTSDQLQLVPSQVCFTTLPIITNFRYSFCSR